MIANTIIHEINTSERSCIITLYDTEGDLIYDHVNIGLVLNPDGTANTQSIETQIKKHVSINQELKHNPRIS